MASSSPLPTNSSVPSDTSLRQRVAIAKRSPVRVTITVSLSTHTRLIELSTTQGRSISNLCAFLLETAVTNHP